MTQVQFPKPQPAGENAGNLDNNKWVKKSITLLIPADWEEKIDEYMKEHGYKSLPELLRDLLREVLERGDQ